ncbi:hypothetical protein FB451DRAFT_1520290 [Mycena latifolia]|nr:hypothetical protein FB451DRAFT_1520290 [Mycena latifolia]
MPLQPTAHQDRFRNIVTSLAAAVDTLEILSQGLKSPFLGAISNSARSLLTIVQRVRKNKDDCTQLMEQTHLLIYAIVSVHAKSDMAELSPNMLNHLGKFTETLHKIHTFVEAQQDKSRIKLFFRQGEMSMLLKDCHSGLQQALDLFKVEKVQDGDSFHGFTDMQKYAEKRHQEVIELIESLSDTHSDCASSRDEVFSSSYNSSNSISMLPSEPKIFHGRETELAHILNLFAQEPTRIAILGSGGMGKTCLAKVILHHPDIASRYGQHRVFVACDSASTKVELTALIGAYLGLDPRRDLTKAVIRYFSTSPPSLLILDNLETLWEPTNIRGDIEEFLSLLTDVLQLAVVITMRGAERPAKVQWTRPFLQPLKPLTQDAARQMFVDIADEGHDRTDIDKVLLLSDNMPLAIGLLAHLVDSEGCSYVLSQWHKEKTSLISEGYDKQSNLDLSISMSLKSPRISSLPQSQHLLSVLSLLPDGLSDIDLLHSKLPMDNILHCKATLLQTSLAYLDDQRRLKALVPIREYMQKFQPPATKLVQPLVTYFHEFLQVVRKYFGTTSSSGLLTRLISHLANIEKLLLNALHVDSQDIVNTIYCALDFNSVIQSFGYASIGLIDQIPNVLPHPKNYPLEVFYMTEVLYSWEWHPVPNMEALIHQAIQDLTHFDDSNLKCKFPKWYLRQYYQNVVVNLTTAAECFQTAVALSISCGNVARQSGALTNLAWINWQVGDYHAGQTHAYEARRVAKIGANMYSEAGALVSAAICANALGNYKETISYCKEATNLLGLCGIIGGITEKSVMNTLAEAHRLKSEFLEARHIHTQILDKITIQTDPFNYALVLYNIAEIDLEIDAPKHEVQSKIVTAHSMFNTLKFTRGGLSCDVIQGDLDLRGGNPLTAKHLFQKCIKLSWGTMNDVVTSCLEKLGDSSHWNGTHWTWTWTVVFLVHSSKLKQKLDIFKALQFLRDVFQAENDIDTATSLFTVALNGFTEMDIHRERAKCMLRLGDLFKDQGDVSRALGLWKTARPLFERSSQEKKVAAVDRRIVTVTQVVTRK